MKKTLRNSVAVVLIAVVFTGCTFSTNGRFMPHSQFVYPNSNVKVLGPVVARQCRVTPIIPYEITLEDMTKTYNKALAGQAGANLLVNYTEDVSIVMICLYIPIYIVTYELKGDAARMEVGEQDLS